MGIKTYLKRADASQVRNNMEGTVLTAPALIYTDGENGTYACDVDVGQEGIIDDNGTIGVLPLYNVPIAQGNRALLYARPGNAVLLRLTNRGTWEISGFSKAKMGEFVVIDVTLPNICDDFPTIGLGSESEMGLTQRMLTLEEWGTWRPFGELPLGAQAQFLNGELYGFVT